MPNDERSEIVVGVDGSAPSRAALRWALGQARPIGARVRAVIAWEVPTYTGWARPRHQDLGAAAGRLLGEAVRDVPGRSSGGGQPRTTGQDALELVLVVWTGRAGSVMIHRLM